MQSSETLSEPGLLELPEPCLLAVLRCCADDSPCTLFNAARAHSRLHQAAVAVLSNLRAVVRSSDSMLLYLSKHGQHLASISLQGKAVNNHKPTVNFPHNLQRLTSLELHTVRLQLQPGPDAPGAPPEALSWAGVPLKQLQLNKCTLDGQEGPDRLAAALLQSTGLQHLSISEPRLDAPGCMFGVGLQFPSDTLGVLQQLTHLDLFCQVQQPPGLLHLSGLTRLQDLRLDTLGTGCVKASMLSGLGMLTRFEVLGPLCEPGILAGKTRLQHFMGVGLLEGDSAGLEELLSHLAQLQQLTHLQWTFRMPDCAAPAAYSALTASSKLQHLSVNLCMLPAGVWQQVLPAGTQLPRLQVLDVGDIYQPDGAAAAAPEGSRLVSCCPGLQSVKIRGLRYSSELLAPLVGLSGLTQLHLSPDGWSMEGLDVVCQLTGLRALELRDLPRPGMLLQLTVLKQLTRLEYGGILERTKKCFIQDRQAPCDEPVWRQLLRAHLGHSDPEVAAQAAAALAALGKNG